MFKLSYHVIKTGCSYTLGKCMALWGDPIEPSYSTKHHVYNFMQCVDS